MSFYSACESVYIETRPSLLSLDRLLCGGSIKENEKLGRLHNGRSPVLREGVGLCLFVSIVFVVATCFVSLITLNVVES